MRDILLKHFETYPKMQVTDAVKLLYQSEFGGGHMIANPVKSLNWIKNEWEQIRGSENAGDCDEQMKTSEGVCCLEKDPVNAYDKAAVLEEIGGGICRVSLHALADGISAETLNRIFVKTADRTVGTVETFEKKLDLLRELCADGAAPFSSEELEQYLAEYKANGYPPVSHSEVYREHYHPSYRVVSTSYTRYYHVFRQIDRALAAAGENQVVVSIDGMCGSGKSTLGRILEEVYNCNLFHMDDFFLRPEQRTPERFAEPGGNVDYERFKEEILDHIADPEGFTYQVYNCGIQALDGYVTVPYKKLNIIEGAYSNHPYFGAPYDLKFLCEITPEEQFARIMKRNGPEMLERFKAVWIPMENRYFEEFGVKNGCVLV